MVAFRPPDLWAQESFVPIKQLVGQKSFMLAFDCIHRMVQTTNYSEPAAIPHRDPRQLAARNSNTVESQSFLSIPLICYIRTYHLNDPRQNKGPSAVESSLSTSGARLRSTVIIQNNDDAVSGFSEFLSSKVKVQPRGLKSSNSFA